MKPLLKLIHPKRRKNIYMCTLVLLTTVGFNIMRGMRETVVFQFGKNGALYTPFIRILGVLPISALLFIIYLSVKKKYNTLAAYYAITIPFLMYFLGYSLFSKQIMIDTSQHPEWILLIRDFYRPLEFVGVIIQHWDKTLYYVFCEAWGSFTLVILFWQMANEHYSKEDAAKYYPIFSMLGGVGIIISSIIISQMGKHPNITQLTTRVILAIGICNCWLVSRIWQQVNTKFTPQKKTTVKLREGLKIALASPHILYLTICIISFSVLCNIYENAVRNIILNHYSNERAVFTFWGSFFMGKGLLVISANVLSRALLKRVGWFYVAITTPIVSIVSTHFVLTIPGLQHFSGLTGNAQFLLWVLTILLQLNFAVKYAFFDPTKEMAYIPLTDHEKTFGKTVADGIGSRVGNIGSGVLQTIAIMIASGSDFAEIAPTLLSICSIVSLGWVWAMRGLSMTYKIMTEEETPKTDIAAVEVS